MEDLMETGFGTLPAHLTNDVDRLKELIIDEIERSLPKIISGLEMPPPIDTHELHILQHRLRAGRGFRPLSPAERVKSVEKLKHEGFLKTLRKVQEQALLDLSFNNTGAGVCREPFSLETTNTRPWHGVREDLTEIGVPEIKDIEKLESATISSPKAGYAILQEQTRVERPGELVSKAAPDIESKQSILEIPNTPIELQEPVAQRNVSGLIAVLKDGRLLTFVEPATLDLIPKDVDTIPIPDKRVFHSLNLDNLMSEYHDLAVAQSTAHAVELRLLDALIVSLENEAQWSRINKRRFHLITKRHSVGLDSAQNDELEELQRLADKHADSVQAIPFSELAMLQEYARKLGFLEGSSPQ
jgi:hypothetical protein